MTIWIVAYEQEGEREICVEVFYSNRDAVNRANEVDEELMKLGDGYINTSITEYEIDTGASK